MNLYERDYSKAITAEEEGAQILYIEYSNRKIKCTTDDPRFNHPNIECRKFLWRYNSLFPNNYIDFVEFDLIDFSEEADNYRSILSDFGTEQAIQSYIKDNRKWFLPGSILMDYNFGHHDAYLFPEMMLGSEHKVDYALLGKNSDGYSMVFVEFENANTKFLIDSSNSESESVRKGITQIRDWKNWIENNRDYFLNSSGLRNEKIDIPLTRFYYYLVVSKREKMDNRALEARNRICYEMINTKIATFDRLADNICKLNNTY